MHRISYLLADGFQVLSLATQAAFELANIAAQDTFYTVENFSLEGGKVRSSLGLALDTQPLETPRLTDTWIIVGVTTPLEVPASAATLEFLRQASTHARRTVGLCTGAFILAEAGLLSGRRATTHWAFAREMQRRYPDISVEEDRIYIADGTLWTSAGMTAGLDLALGLVEKDLGADIARSVARKLVMQQYRSGGQSQHSELLHLAPKSDRIQRALDYARQHLNRPLGVEELAEVVNLSPRQFSRVFSAETGHSPAKAIEGLRLEAARLMIEQSRHSLDVVAQETGFRDRRHMREVFLRGFGIPPQAIRRDARRPMPS
ncbi:GlxA family transcriptional regulator [Pseudomonas putida]|uniref:GlxA family transcriptional regulator n=1 Tax=Pseudomonas TaxID=286 RepID=UPI003465EF53